MKLLRKVTLYFREGNSDKIYEVELCEHSSQRSQRYVVNFRYGRRGGTLREGTKTTTPVDLTDAEEIFTSLVVSKENKGYLRTPTENHPPAPAAPHTDNTDPDRWHQRLLALLDSSDRDRRHRAIWRVGEIGLTTAHGKLLMLATQGDVPQIYCAIWALGRLQQPAAVPLLSRLCQHNDERVRRMAQDALIACLPPQERRLYLDNIKAELPQALQALWQHHDISTWVAAITQAMGSTGEQAFVLETLYRLSHDQIPLHHALCDIIATLPLQPPYFRVFRHVFKSAEFHLDAKLLGIISHRLEHTKPVVTGRWLIHPQTRKLTAVEEELKKPDSVVAYSTATRQYLRRRLWRLCRRLGEIDDDRYVPLAMGILTAITDADASAPTTRERYEWKRVDRRYQRVLTATKHYPAGAGYLAFNHILFENSKQYRLSASGRAWEFDATQAVPRRAEAFPDLWDRHPQALLTLLQTSHNAMVQHFAVRALRDNQEFCAQISSADLCLLLISPYRDTSLFALALAQARLKAAQPEWPLLTGMLDAPTDEARQAALHWLATTSATPPAAEIPSLWAALISNADTTVRAWARQHLPWLSQLDINLLLPLLEQRLPRIATSAAPEALLCDVIYLLCDKLRDASAALALAWPRRLLFSAHAGLQQLGAELLLVNQLPLANIPADVLARIHNADTAGVRALGIRLLQKLSTEELLAQADAVISATLSLYSDIRQAALPLATQLIQQDKAFAHHCLQTIMAVLFQAELAVGMHDALLAFTQQTLTLRAQQLDSGTVWRLLHARSRGAQRLGEWLLRQRDATQWSVRQWATLGAHPTLAVRDWVQHAYNAHLERIRADKSNALRLLNSPWPEMQTFALTFFRTHFDETDWTPSLLIYLVDHVEDPVQRFGRELITRFFDAGAGPEYLAKLSQHPSLQVQLFASNFLQDHAGNQPDRILALQHYFLTVLSHVNRARVAKDRVLQFLANEADHNEQVAALTSQLLTRLSATVSREDKARFLPVLLALKKRYPDLASPITVNAPALKVHRGVDNLSPENRHAV